MMAMANKCLSYHLSSWLNSTQRGKERRVKVFIHLNTNTAATPCIPSHPTLHTSPQSFMVRVSKLIHVFRHKSHCHHYFTYIHSLTHPSRQTSDLLCFLFSSLADGMLAREEETNKRKLESDMKMKAVQCLVFPLPTQSKTDIVLPLTKALYLFQFSISYSIHYSSFQGNVHIV